MLAEFPIIRVAPDAQCETIVDMYFAAVYSLNSRDFVYCYFS